MQKLNPKNVQSPKNANPKPQTLQVRGTKPYIHNPKMQKLNPKKFYSRKMPTPNPKPYKLKTPSPTYTTQKCKN